MQLQEHVQGPLESEERSDGYYWMMTLNCGKIVDWIMS